MACEEGGGLVEGVGGGVTCCAGDGRTGHAGLDFEGCAGTGAG